MSKVLRAAVIGVGYLGNFHVQKYRALTDVALVGVADTDAVRVREIRAKYDLPVYSDFHALLGQVDLVSIVVPPAKHFEIAATCLQHGVHVLVEKPVTETVAEAETLIGLATKGNLVLQVGHLERFNPAVIALRELINAPQTIEAQRLARYKERGTDIDVVLDLMIHDIDIVLSLIREEIIALRASGTSVVSGDIDIAHARLEFAGGCVAELNASRVSRDPVRCMYVRQPGSYISIDYSNHQLLHGSLEADRDGVGEVAFDMQTHIHTDVLMDEIRSFVDVVRAGDSPAVSGEDGRRALEVAIEVSQRINARLSEGTDAARETR